MASVQKKTDRFLYNGKAGLYGLSLLKLPMYNITSSPAQKPLRLWIVPVNELSKTGICRK